MVFDNLETLKPRFNASCPGADFVGIAIDREVCTLSPGAALGRSSASNSAVKDERLAASSFPARKEEQKKHADDFIAAFEQADYDAKTQTDSPDAGASAHEQMEKEVHFLSQLVAILKPDQREKLAAERSPGAQGQHHMMPGMGGPGGPPGMPGMRPGGPGMPMPMGAPPAPPPHP